MIDSYSDHFIICGFGRVGRQVARDLRARRCQARGDRLRTPSNREARRRDGRAATSRATPPTTRCSCRRGSSARAAVIACVDSDAENIFIALTARELRPDILIVARASAEDSEKKLLRAGADRVISPYKTSGSEMARVALHPQVGGAVQIADYRMEEIEVSPACDGVGKTIEQVRGESVIVARAARGRRLEPQPVAAGGDRGGRHAGRDRHAGGARAARDRVPAAGGARAP